MSVPSVLARLAADEFLLSTYKKNISQIHLIRLRSIEMVLPIDRNTIFNESSRRKKLCLDSELDLRYSLPAV